MGKIYGLVLLGLLTSTSVVFAMDPVIEETDLGADIGGFSSSASGGKGTTKVAPEGSDVPWYDDVVASGSPDARGRTKSYEEGDWDEEGLLGELAERASEGTKDPLAASVMMSAATHTARLSLEKMAEEDADDSLPQTAAFGRQVSEIEDETIEGETPTAVAAPMVPYFDTVPDRETAERILRGLLKGKNTTFTTNQLKLVLNYLFDPTQDEMPKEGFDFNEFARNLAACVDIKDQRKLLTKMENEHGEAWQSDEEDEEGGEG